MDGARLSAGDAKKLERIIAAKRYAEQLRIRAEMAKRRADHARSLHKTAFDRVMELISADSSQMTLPGMDDHDDLPSLPTWRDIPIWVVLGRSPESDTLSGKGLDTLGKLSDAVESKTLVQVGLTAEQERRVYDLLHLYWDTPDDDTA